LRILYLLFVHLVLAICLSGSVKADTTYVVKKGDNPSTIAKKFNVATKVILAANDINPRYLKPGTKITIPSDKHVSAGKTGTAKKQGVKSGLQKVAPVIQRENPSAHIVKKGDTLSFIAKKYSVSVGDLKETNNLRSEKLKPGQRLLVRKENPKTYKVKKGDTVYRIAKKFGKDADELVEINNLEAGMLQPGRTILLEPEEDTGAAKTKTYGAILSQDHIERDAEKASGSVELSGLSLQDRLILFAKKMLDIPYRFGGNSLWGIDCSAYVQKVYGIIGINLPRSAREQFTEGDPVDIEELSIGDLVFFRTYASFPSHVGIYLGNDLFIHASSRSKKVTIDSLETPYYLKRFIGAKRVIDGETMKEVPGREG